jgi:hypothetical protein
MPQESLHGFRSIPRGIWALGFVSMSMDVSSEMIHSILPVFLVSVLGASATALGLLEGLAEGTVNVVKMFSGGLSDWLGKRKALGSRGIRNGSAYEAAFPSG